MNSISVNHLAGNPWVKSAVGAVLLLAACFTHPVDARSKPLFGDSPSQASIAGDHRPTEMHRRRVQVDWGVLEGADLPEGAPTVTLNLFPGVDLAADKTRFERRSPRGFTWFGKVQGDRLSSVVLTAGDGLMRGLVQANGRLFEIRGASAADQVVVEIDQSAFPPEGCDQIPAGDAPPTEPPKAPAQDALGDSGSVIDVLVVYTPAARDADGGTAAIQLLAQNSVDVTNNSYMNSGVNPRLHLAHAAEVSYTESADTIAGWEQDLNLLTGYGDGQLDGVHALRDAYAADVVVMLVRRTWQICGFAKVIMADASTAFSLAGWDCSAGNLSLGHEIGHLQGARHDTYVDPTLGSPYDYNHGHVDLPSHQRTVMAYNNECGDSGFYCTRLAYWSNPGVAYPYNPAFPDPTPNLTGTASRENNTLVLNTTAATVANFRQVPTLSLTVMSAYPAVGVPITVSPADVGGLGSGDTQFVRSYTPGAAVTLTASSLAWDDNLFDSWSGCTATGGTFGEICTVTMDANRTVIVNYARDLDARPVASVLWSNAETGQAMLRQLDPDTKVLQNSIWLYSPAGIGAPWKATSYTSVDPQTAYVLWTRSDNGKAVLWKVDPSLASGTPSVIPVEAAAHLYSSAGIGGPWQATSFKRVSATEGYVLWTRSDAGKGVLWRISPDGLGTLAVIPVEAAAHLYSSAGIGGPWQATSFERVSATEGYVLWTRSDVGKGVLWRISPDGLGTLSTLPVEAAAHLYSSAGVGGPWQATNFEYVSATEGYVLWTRGDIGRAVWWRIDPDGIGTLPVIPIVSSGQLPPDVGNKWQAAWYAR